jgi:hypothetical protein
MPRKRFVPHRQPELPEMQFPNAEAAWFWYMRCQQARWDGANFQSGMAIATHPCDPDDVYRAVRQLERKQKLRREHLGALYHFGMLDRPPDPHCPDETLPCRWWDEALDKLTTVLRQKDIIE